MGGSLNWKSKGMGGYIVLMIGIPKSWGVLGLEFPQETDKSVFLEYANMLFT